MEVILSMLNSIPSPYSDFVAVAVIFVLIALISFIIAFLVERKAQKQAQGLEIEEDVKPPAETQEVIEDLDVAGDLEAVNEPIEEVPDIQGPDLQTQTTQLSEELLETEPPPSRNL